MASLLKLISFLLLSVAAFSAPVPSSAVVIQTTHSTIYGSVVASEAPYAMRVRYGKTLAYESGAGGGVQGQYTAIHYPTDGLYRWAIGGLESSTLTYGCVELSADTVTWSACATFTVTTSALPAVHPALPIAPTEVNTTRADWSGWTQYTTLSDCSNLAAKITDAKNNQAAGNNSLVVLPGTGVTCPTVTLPSASQWVAVTADPVTNQFTKIGHGFASNQRLRLATALNYTYMPGGMYYGNDYYVISVDANHFKLSATAGSGTEVDFSTAGALVYVLPWPPSSVPWIYVVNSKVLDGTFLPEGVRVNSEWDSAMPVIYSTGSGANGTTPAILFPDMSVNWRFIGVKIATPDTATAELAATNTTDVTGSGWYVINNITRSAGGIIFEQCRFVAAPWPNRMARFITTFDGSDNAIIDSDFENMVWWQGYSNILGTKTNASTVKFSAGVYNGGLFTMTLPTDVTVTITGGSNTCVWDPTSLDGCFIVYATKDSVLHAVFPAGMAATCTGYASCVVETPASPALPMSGGKVQAVYLMVGKLTSGAFDEIYGIDMNNGPFASQGEYQANRTSLHYPGEGGTAILCGQGPGPLTFRNNRMDGVGTPFFCDDSSAYAGGLYNYQTQGTSNVVVKRNLFTTDWNQHLNGDKGAPGHRNMLESKSGSQWLVKGNIFENCFGELHRSSDIQFTALAGRMDDIDLVSNVQRNCGHHGPWPGLYASIGQPMGYPPRRIRLYNNLFYGNDIIAYRMAWRPSQYTAGAGIAHHLQGHAAEDYILQNNTYYDFWGGDPSFIRRANGPMEGVKIVNNFIMVSNTLMKREGDDFGAGYAQTTCTGTSKQLADCWYRAGAGNPDLIFSGNLLMPGYADRTIPTAFDLTTFCTDLGGTESPCTGGLATGNKVVTGSTVADRLTNTGLIGTSQIIDFTLKYASTFRGKDIPTTDGRNPGVNPEELKAALGIIDSQRALGVASTAATIAFTVHDGATGVACRIGYGTASTPPSWVSSSTNTAASRFRTIGLTSLSPSTTYKYQVWCNGMPSTTTDSFTTMP